MRGCYLFFSVYRGLLYFLIPSIQHSLNLITTTTERPSLRCQTVVHLLSWQKNEGLLPLFLEVEYVRKVMPWA